MVVHSLITTTLLTTVQLRSTLQTGLSQGHMSHAILSWTCFRMNGQIFNIPKPQQNQRAIRVLHGRQGLSRLSYYLGYCLVLSARLPACLTCLVAVPCHHQPKTLSQQTLTVGIIRVPLACSSRRFSALHDSSWMHNHSSQAKAEALQLAGLGKSGTSR